MAEDNEVFLHIKTLGGLSITQNGRPLTRLASRKTEALLVYLACTRREISRELLAEMLWDDRTQQQAMANLRVVLSSLRKEASPFVIINRKMAAINPNTKMTIDAIQLEQAGTAALKQNGIQTAQQAKELNQALDRYKGDFLAGFFLPEASGFENWVATETERLRQLTIDSYLVLNRWYMDRQDYVSAVASATRLVHLDPLTEIGHRHLIESLARSDHRVKALAQYEHYCQILKDELGIEPDLHTKALYKEIKANALQIKTAPVVMDPQKKQIKHNLPTQTTPFFGRDLEIAELSDLILKPTVRMITITGIGGTGKTRLAAMVAKNQLHLHEPLFTDGIYCVAMAAFDRPEQMITVIANTVDLPFTDAKEDGRSEKQQLIDYLKNKKILLLLDNFEQLVDSALLLSEILRNSRYLRLLITSRERLNLQEERVYQLNGFSPLGRLDLDEIQNSPFAQLFCHVARRFRPIFKLQQEDLKPLARLHELTGGLPLAVELAASWIEVLPLSKIVKEVQKDFDFLESDRPDIPRRQRNMNTLFESAWQRLTPPLQELFSRLCIFRGGFTRSAAKAVAGASLKNLATLSHKSLLHYIPDEDRYQIHEFLRQYGKNKLKAMPDGEQEVEFHHACYFTTFLSIQEQEWFGKEASAVLKRVKNEMGNIHQAWNWAVRQGETELINKSLESLCTYYTFQGNLAEAADLLQIAIESLTVLIGENDLDNANRLLLIRLLARRGEISNSVEEGRSFLVWADALIEELKQRGIDVAREEALIAGVKGNIELRVDPTSAFQSFNHALNLYKNLGDVLNVAKTRIDIGAVELALGNYKQAADLVRKGLRSQKLLGNHKGMAMSLSMLGLIEKHIGNFSEAYQAYSQSYELFSQSGDKFGMANISGLLAGTLGSLGEYEKARTMASEGLSIARELGREKSISFLSYMTGELLINLGLYDEAEPYLSQSLELGRALGQSKSYGWPLTGLGRLAIVKKRCEDAVAHLKASADALFEDKSSFWMLPLVYQALSFQMLGQQEIASTTLARALSENMDSRIALIVIIALPVASLIKEGHGDREGAVALYSQACQFPHVSNSIWYHDVIGRKIEKIAATLPPDALAAAKRRGEERQLWQTAESLLKELTEAG